ncbi:anti-sigma-I factor RsgI4-like [Schistocerca cancellata]|uniref:anti-sigma-I factor RsgI4-like n=1 Tax=Schistocerca cancellata TaxID=274614 RepID=UPI00211826C4|nr:anti-sigma-I factor RsgI4-like [Schistocerca cancellata]
MVSNNKDGVKFVIEPVSDDDSPELEIEINKDGAFKVINSKSGSHVQPDNRDDEIGTDSDSNMLSHSHYLVDSILDTLETWDKKEIENATDNREEQQLIHMREKMKNGKARLGNLIREAIKCNYKVTATELGWYESPIAETPAKPGAERKWTIQKTVATEEPTTEPTLAAAELTTEAIVTASKTNQPESLAVTATSEAVVPTSITKQPESLAFTATAHSSSSGNRSSHNIRRRQPPLRSQDFCWGKAVNNST